MFRPVRDKEWQLEYTVRIRASGTNKARRVAEIGRRVARFGWVTFGDRFEMYDHRGRRIKFDPDAHDFGLGEA